jgi:hypothetical protein
MMRRARPRQIANGAAALAVAIGLTGTVAARQLSRDEALALAYPGGTVAAERVFLTADQMKAASARAAVEVPSALIARYIVRRDGALVGRAYVDTHTVRTKKESLLIALDASGRVKRVDVVAFLEPQEYQAPPAFLGQFGGRGLEDDVRVNRAIRPIAGATLTAGAVTDAVRRVLAIDAVLSAGGGTAGGNRR